MELNKSLSLALAEQEAYWLKTLYGELPTSDALLDHPRPATQLFLHDTITLRVDALLPSLTEIARREKSDLLSMLLAAFSLVIMRHTDEMRVMLGTIAPAGTSIQGENKETAPNPLALLIDATDDPLISQFLQTITVQLAEAGNHRDFPFDSLITALHLEAGGSRAPLFQVLVACLDQPTALGGPPLSAEDVELVKAYSAQCDITLLAHFDGDDLTLQCHYDTTLFDPATIDILLAHLRVALLHLADDCHVASVDLLDDAERDRLLSAEFFPQPETVWKSLYDYVASWALQQPNQPAIISNNGEISYGDLNSRVESMARQLRSVGVASGTIVALYLERGIDSLIAILAVIRSGGIYLPLDTSLPAHRLAYLLEDAGSSLLITRQELIQNIATFQGKTLLFDELKSGEQDAGGETPLAPPHDQEPICILYTSGSTGRPKGVVLTHRMVMNLIQWHLSAHTPAQRTLQLASLSFDQSLHEMFSTWGTGGSLIILPDAVKEDVPAFANFLISHRVEKAFLPVVLAQRLAETSCQQGIFPQDLVEMMVTGEQLVITQHMRDFFSHLPQLRLTNQYGPTETHVATFHRLEDRPANWPTHPSIGRPIAHTQTLVLTPSLDLAPIGVWGGLYLAGECLAQGYWQSPHLSAERFIPHPFATQPGQRMYQTGDRVRYHGDGRLEFGGRFDNQIKIRGFRVEPSEIEAVLAEHPEVRNAVVITRQHDQDIWLIAYVVPETAILQEAELRQYLGGHLPSYMVPTIITLIDSLPLNTNGKVDRQKLPEIEITGEASYIQPQSEDEQKIVTIWQDILHVPLIGIHDNFFALGGHSLLGAQLIARLRQEFQVELTQFDIFETPTVAGIASLIESVKLLAKGEGQPEDHWEELG